MDIFEEAMVGHGSEGWLMGEGSGVMSTSGPRPGEEKAEAGDSEPPV